MTAIIAIAAVATTGLGFGAPNPAAAVNDSDWLGIVNTYRAMSGLQPVTENATWSAQSRSHSCYMLQNGIAHDEIPGKTGYTEGGDIAGNSGNVAVSSSITADARNHIDLWMTGPFHTIGILRHNLKSAGFGLCTSSNTPTPWASGGTLDVLRGLDNNKPRPSTPILFPGEGSTVPLTRFITESPNPMTMCGWSGNAGLPLIALMPNTVNWANSTLTGPSGPIETCVLHKGNVSNSTARSILGGENAVVVMPRKVLADGNYTATVETDGGSVTWSFHVDQSAPLDVEPPDIPEAKVGDTPARFQPVSPFRHVDTRIGKNAVRLRAGKITSIVLADSDTVAVSANFVAIQPDANGFLTVYNCTSELPTVSTIGYGPGDVVANQAIVPLQDGKLCLYSLRSMDVVIDINGYYTKTGDGGYMPVAPERLYDSRTKGRTRLKAGEERPLQVAGATKGAPAAAEAVALNVTVTETAGNGFLQLYPCGSPTASEISTINYKPQESRPNMVVTPVDAGGRVCIRALTDTDLIIDLSGYFVTNGGLDFSPLSPIRMFDSRSRYKDLNTQTNGARLTNGQVIKIKIAGARGVPADAKAVSLNLTATQALNSTYLTVYPCGTRPTASNVNISPWQPAMSNSAMTKLSAGGEICIYTLKSAHVIIDINGIWRWSASSYK